MLPRRYVVEVQNDHIVVRVSGTSYAVSYNRVTYAPWLCLATFLRRMIIAPQ
jgi:hypothetical protein